MQLGWLGSWLKSKSKKQLDMVELVGTIKVDNTAYLKGAFASLIAHQAGHFDDKPPHDLCEPRTTGRLCVLRGFCPGTCKSNVKMNLVV